MENHQINLNLGDSCYGRSKQLSVYQGQCDKCGMGKSIIISIDTSDGEYASLDICVRCVNELSNQFIQEQLDFLKKKKPALLVSIYFHSTVTDTDNVTPITIYFNKVFKYLIRSPKFDYYPMKSYNDSILILENSMIIPTS